VAVLLRRIGYPTFVGAGIGLLLGLTIARPGHSALPGMVIGALGGALIEWIARAADRLSRDKPNDGSRQK
jgi:hypothetical protein